MWTKKCRHFSESEQIIFMENTSLGKGAIFIIISMTGISNHSFNQSVLAKNNKTVRTGYFH
jgi:hypothetical protein